ncbi:MAG: CDP-glycerol glycerophosphotransferase family protein [Anaerolineales bacterium]
MERKSVLISADHGLAIVYFLQSDVVSVLREAGIEVILLTDESIKNQIEERFGDLGIKVEGLRNSDARKYASVAHELQWWLAFLRRVGSSKRINTSAMDSYIRQVAVEEPNRRRVLMPLARIFIGILRHSRRARKFLISAQAFFTPNLYLDLFTRYKPDLVITSTPGWRLDRYLLREAVSSKIPTVSVVVGWDNPSSYGLPGAKVNAISCWSALQKQELGLGSDWSQNHVHIGGIPSYDGYFRGTWRMTREEYFELHHLDPSRKLLSYACSFVSFSPNLQNIEALSNLVNSSRLREPCQLLIRLHPNHFMDVHLFADERARIQGLASEFPNIHVVEPLPLGGELDYYSGEDMPEKASMLSHSDIFLTVYSTMVVEAAIHDRPIISACIDAPNGWDTPRKYSLPLSRIGDWPTHMRFRQAGAGLVAENEDQLCQMINHYLGNPEANSLERSKFVQQEVTYTDGSAGRRTGEFILSLL